MPWPALAFHIYLLEQLATVWTKLKTASGNAKVRCRIMRKKQGNALPMSGDDAASGCDVNQSAVQLQPLPSSSQSETHSRLGCLPPHATHSPHTSPTLTPLSDEHYETLAACHCIRGKYGVCSRERGWVEGQCKWYPCPHPPSQTEDNSSSLLQPELHNSAAKTTAVSDVKNLADGKLYEKNHHINSPTVIISVYII